MSLVGLLVRAEVLKLRSTRTVLGIVLGMVLLIALLIVAVLSAGDAAKLSGTAGARRTLSLTTTGSVFALCLGIIGMAGEYRHGTLGHMLIAAPRRWQIILAKLIAYFVAGALLGLLAFALALALGAGVTAIRGESLSLSGSLPLKIALGSMVGFGLFGAIGVGLGALVKEQVPALLIGIGWTQIVELVLSGAAPDISKYFPGGLLGALMRSSTKDVLPQGSSALLLLAYTALIGGAGLLVARRRDLT